MGRFRPRVIGLNFAAFRAKIAASQKLIRMRGHV
jgi:hypothetical protein